MPRRSRLSIPHELHQIKAQQIYEQRIAKGKNASSEEDWQTARRYLTRYPKIARAWKRNQAIAFYRQLPKSFFRRLARSLMALINGIWKIIIFPLWLIYGLPQLFANTDSQVFALDVVKTIISAASLIAAIIAAIGLLVNYQDALKNRELTEERLVTDRFAKAVEQIGNDKEEVVIGGIYSLERIAKDSPKDQWTIMEVLTAFVRKNSPSTTESQKPKKSIQELGKRSEKKFKTLEKLDPVNIQIQAALTVIGRRDPARDYTSDKAPELKIKRLDLSYGNLSGADLSGADLSGADLNGAHLRDADLSDVFLNDAFLSDAFLRDADLSGADLILANLNDAYFGGAHLRDADLSGARLNDANLNDANLWDTNLNFADFRDADLSSASLSDANLSNANLSNAVLWGASLRDADLSDANLSNAVLWGAENLSNQQIKSACFWEKAIYTDAELNYKKRKWIAVDEKANQKRIEAIKQDKASDSENSPDCNQ